MSLTNLNLSHFSDPATRTLHYTWFAFFLTFVVWFNAAPLKPLITETFNLSNDQWKAILTLNVALTIPARIVIGILVDKFGPRVVYAILLLLTGVLCQLFAWAQNYQQLALARFLLGFAGSGFVIGIRLVGEWFPPRTVGLAQGIYGGWGNFGSAAAAWTLPTLAITLFGGENGWRYAIAFTGVLAFLYGLLFYLKIRDTPEGATYFRPSKSGGLEVSNKRDFWFYIIMNVPMYIILAILAWKLSPSGVGLLGHIETYGMYGILMLLFVYQFSQIVRVNWNILRGHHPAAHDQYKFRQVAILDWAYFVTFGSELAVVSMLPAFFMETFTDMSVTSAGLFGGLYALMNLIARPSGGLISDRLGRRRTLSFTILGLAIGYLLMSQVNAEWPLLLTVLTVMVCSFFVQAGEGAVFAVVPLVKRRMTGQIAGMAGAYGNVGALTFLTVYTFVDASTFFMIIGSSALVVYLIVQWLEEPSGHMTEILPDGRMAFIKVS
ncbi:NarK family nitrate/nitrite MFS transporter [Gynuella sunshinyii]|uniref:Nitrate/nitrite transporter n=1 Tax=Gynuella sunshinyii YC6258 TaxID=1445510 RepID=A0A0C5VNL2_9GAMM|nr:NarK family nitrate/nitrite MFS transporter [Gynuella sunshinyii]AJQ96247.1 nitrate/nitrite transporter [Gynuella sunshinyii YC6258]